MIITIWFNLNSPPPGCSFVTSYLWSCWLLVIVPQSLHWFALVSLLCWRLWCFQYPGLSSSLECSFWFLRIWVSSGFPFVILQTSMSFFWFYGNPSLQHHLHILGRGRTDSVLGSCSSYFFLGGPTNCFVLFLGVAVILLIYFVAASTHSGLGAVRDFLIPWSWVLLLLLLS